MSKPQFSQLGILADARRAAGNLPICPTCGEFWVEIEAFGIRRKVRALCPCQAKARDAEEVERDRAGAQMRWMRSVWAVFGQAHLVREKPGHPQVVEDCARYVETWEARKAEGQGLYLWGGVGTGKTTAMRLVLGELVERHQARVLVVSQSELLEVARDFTGERASKAQNLAQVADLLLLDDLGQGRLSRWGSDVLWRLLDTRRDAGLPVLATSNLAPPDLEGRWTRDLQGGKDALTADEARLEVERITSRLLDGCDVVQLQGDDRRAQGGVVWMDTRRKA